MVNHYHAIPYMVILVQTNKPVINKIMIINCSPAVAEIKFRYTHIDIHMHTHRDTLIP